MYGFFNVRLATPRPSKLALYDVTSNGSGSEKDIVNFFLFLVVEMNERKNLTLIDSTVVVKNIEYLL